MIEINKIPAGFIQIPPSKSIGHRLLFAAFLASDASTIAGVGKSADIMATIQALTLIGRQIEYRDGSVTLKKLPRQKKNKITEQKLASQREKIKNMPRLDKPEDADIIEIQVLESGTTLRFLLPLLLALEIEANIQVSSQLFRRGNQVLIEILNGHGGQITMKNNRFEVRGKLIPGVYWIPGNISSQYISGLFFALSILDTPSLLWIDPPLESAPYVDMTMNIINDSSDNFVVEQKITLQRNRRIQGFEISPTTYLPSNQSVEGDYSNASFFLISAILGAQIEILGLIPHSIQGDEYICTFLQQMQSEFSIGPNGGLVVKRELGLLQQARDIIFYAQEYPDLVPPIVAFLVHQRGTHEVKGAQRLRLKESNRLAALVSEFSKLGANIKETTEGLWIEGGLPLHKGQVESHNDHRIAMAIAASSVYMTEPVILTGSKAVNKSHPDFWKDFLQVEK